MTPNLFYSLREETMFPEPAYRDLFATYLLGTIRQSVARVEAHEYTVPEGDRVQAWHVLSYALAEEDAWDETKALLLALAPRMELAGFRYDWIPYLEQGAERARACDDEEAVAELGLEIGLLWQRVGRYDDARTWLQEAERTFARRSAPRRRALALNRLADTAQQQGRLHEARRLASAAMSMVAEDAPERAHSLFVLGLVAFDEREWEEAQCKLERAAVIWEEMGADRRAALCLQNLGRVHMARKNYNQAITFFENAATAFKSVGDVDRLTAALINMGIIYYLQKQFGRADEFYELAARDAKRTQNESTLAMLNTNRGLLCLARQQWKEAEMLFHVSIEQRRKLGNEAACLNPIDGLGLALIGQERYREAASLYKEALVELRNLEGERQHKRLHKKLTTHLQQAKSEAQLVEQQSLTFV